MRENNNNDIDTGENQNEIQLDNLNDNNYKIKLSLEKDLESFEKIKKIEKIVCPECGEIPILDIDNKNYTIQSFCPKNHQINKKLVDYIENSNKKFEDESPECIKCSTCQKTNKELKIDINDMYYCRCEKYFCEDCKEKHEEENEENENEEDENHEEKEDKIIHNLIKYSEIDFKCKCSKEFSDYICYCVNCNKNFCINCLVEHKSNQKGHQIINFTDQVEKYLTKEKIEAKKKEFSQQEENINKFLVNLDEWKEILELKIRHLKENLKLLVKVNKYLLFNFDKATMNQQTIESTKNLDFSYEPFINEFNNKKKNNILNNERENFNIENNIFEQQYGYLLGLLSYQKNTILAKKEKKSLERKKIENLNIIKNIPQIETKVESKITSICQFNKDILIGDEKGLIHLYKLDQNLTKIFTISDNPSKEINYLCPLKNKYFISSNEDEIKIIKIDKTDNKTQYNILQSFEYNNTEINEKNDSSEASKDEENLSKIFPKDHRLTVHPKKKDNKNTNEASYDQEFLQKRSDTMYNKNTEQKMKNNNKKNYYQIMELINNNVIYIDKDKLMRLEPVLNNNYNKKELSEIKNSDKIICIAEINENKFCACFENNEIIIFDSNTFSVKGEKTKVKFNDENEKLIKIESINNSMLAGITKSKIYVISLVKVNEIKIIREVDTQMVNIDMKIAVNPCKILIAGYHKNNNYINQYNFELTKNGMTSSKDDSINSETRINMIFLYGDEKNNAKLVIIHNNNFIKTYLNNNNNNNMV